MPSGRSSRNGEGMDMTRPAARECGSRGKPMHREAVGSPTPDEAKLLFLEDPPERADLAIVFGHSNPQLAASRARHAALLFNDGFVPRLLLSGGGHPAPGEPCEAHRMAEV